MTNLEIINGWEACWEKYVTKIARIDELKAAGRYGYQLRMPYKSLTIAIREMREFCATHNIEVPKCV